MGTRPTTLRALLHLQLRSTRCSSLLAGRRPPLLARLAAPASPKVLSGVQQHSTVTLSVYVAHSGLWEAGSIGVAVDSRPSERKCRSLHACKCLDSAATPWAPMALSVVCMSQMPRGGERQRPRTGETSVWERGRGTGSRARESERVRPSQRLAEAREDTAWRWWRGMNVDAGMQAYS